RAARCACVRIVAVFSATICIRYAVTVVIFKVIDAFGAGIGPAVAVVIKSITNLGGVGVDLVVIVVAIVLRKNAPFRSITGENGCACGVAIGVTIHIYKPRRLLLDFINQPIRIAVVVLAITNLKLSFEYFWIAVVAVVVDQRVANGSGAIGHRIG